MFNSFRLQNPRSNFSMSLYSDFAHPVRDAILKAHDETLRSFAAPGTWWNAAERCAIVAEARDARCEAGLQEPLESESSTVVDRAGLAETARRVARQVAVSTNDLDRSFCDQALADGLSDTEYTETVGIVALASALDVFARGIGVPSRALPSPQGGEPSGQRPTTARDEGAWVQSIPGGRRGGQEAIDTYGSDNPQAAPFVYRALSLVPEEAKSMIRHGTAQYLLLEEFMNPEFTLEPGITRPQVELVAARVSAINQCFY